MKSVWKYLLYASIVMVGGFILFETIRLKNTGFEGKTLWDWMELLIIPLFLTLGAIIIGWWERKTEREIATDRQQEAALQAYIDRISELLLKEKLRTTRKKEVRDVARTRTLSIMRVLDTERNELIIQFLREAKLVTDKKSILNGANMEGMNLQNLRLNSVYMQDAYLGNANLKHANLFGVNLQHANLKYANLEGSNLRFANLQKAELEMSNLQGADLTNANLENSNLYHANLEGAVLLDTNLQGAYLVDAHSLTKEQLRKVKSLKGARMPDGIKHD